MKLRLPQKPDHELLSAAFGLRLPQTLYRYFVGYYDRAAKNGETVAERFFAETDWYLCNAHSAFGYGCTPIEFYSFANFGVDGWHIGAIIYDFGLNIESAPVGTICPMDDGGVVVYGHDAQEAFHNLLMEQRNFVYNFVPPAGWRCRETVDGTGVLAPAELFADTQMSYERATPTDQVLEIARSYRDAGLDASALVYLKDAYWRTWTEDDSCKRLLLEQSEVYAALGRVEASERCLLRLARMRLA